ncbi:MAG: Uncharacterised protein [Methanobacteriota archaeon]|nr:MAG: Uncharacterised protein [Euryarchaeota archaeon]
MVKTFHFNERTTIEPTTQIVASITGVRTTIAGTIRRVSNNKTTKDTAKDIAVVDNCDELSPSNTFCNDTKSPVTNTLATPESSLRIFPLSVSFSSPNSSSNHITNSLDSDEVDTSTLISVLRCRILSPSR